MAEFGLNAQASQLLNQVRQIFGSDNVIVTSGYRNPARNAGIPGASNTSQHLSGGAFDFKVKGLDPLQVQKVLQQSGITYGQSIAEYGAGMGPRNHLGVGTKMENLVALDGKYTSLGSGLLKTVRDWEASLLKAAGFSDGAATTLTDPNASVTEAVGAASESWFGRIAIGLFALLLITAALFMLGRGEISAILPKAK
jgi:hypothetical protein